MPAFQSKSAPSAAFDSIAGVYDNLFTDSPIGRAQRKIVWDEMDRAFHPGQRILEINCGTGVDALYLASRGVAVDACDSAPGMIARAQQRAGSSSVRARVRFRCVPTEEVNNLSFERPYDGVLSNFSGLDCISSLEPVARNLAGLIKPGGRAVLCVFGSFCLWEVLWYLSAGQRQKAFRRFHRRGLNAALSPGVLVTVHYRSVGTLRKVFTPDFRLERWRGIGVVSPPSYAASVTARFPRLFRFAAAIDGPLGRLPVMRSIADHVVLTFERVSG